MKLYQFPDHKKAVSMQVLNGTCQFGSIEDFYDSLASADGCFEIINGSWYAIFSSEKKNYLLLAGKILLITDEIRIECDINGPGEKSSFSGFNGDKKVDEVEYINSKVFINPMDGMEDWEAVDFGYFLSKYLEAFRNDHNRRF